MKRDITGTIGLDLGDKYSAFCWLDEAGEVIKRGRIKTRSRELSEQFVNIAPSKIIIEVGTHSPWVNRLLAGMGHHVVVANPRKLKVIWQNDYKNDDNDAELLARVGRYDERLLSPIQHRGEDAQADLGKVRACATLVEVRTKLINAVRGSVKSFGARLPSCSSETFHKKVGEDIPEALQETMKPLLRSIEVLTGEVRSLDKQIAVLGSEKYPETERVRAIGGVGPVTALTFMLTVDDPSRFERYRDIGPFLGLVPGQDQSGNSERQRRITKAGDTYLRTLLIQCAHYILGPFGPDCDLRDFGIRLIERGGKSAKKKAAVAVARKLAILMLRLWQTGEPYDPFHNRKKDPNKKVYILKDVA